MKKIFGLFFGLLMCLSFTSCAVPAEAQIYETYSYDGSDVDVDIIINYGTPYYNSEGLLLYYIYRDLFYYPFYSSNRWYFRPYVRPVKHYKPVPRDFYRHNPHANYDRITFGTRPNRNHRPYIRNERPRADRNRPSTTVQRPNGNMRSSTRIQSQPRSSFSPRPQMNRGNARPSNGGGHFGGRR